MTILTWLIGLAILAFASWSAAAFLLGLGHMGRLIATLAPPAVVAGALVWLSYLESRRIADPGWDAVFVVVSIGVGGCTMIAMLPIWFLAEEKLGWRAR